ncbi:DUF2459 domain-containing protein [Xanthobacter dioxanivorans]|uniref:DUF2459 domain-containing protein n=1 Tax=Xanthobacter dioxanivorans TaxID=2528964 RepID=A0A974PLM0_9HYPH|nr:DUF2459 domain-containing protein [Xanthobacter dioxanivorans]QRG05819.1 DUF2459 domain-containing protein [Xanthobacter dioxanivorans]
MRRRALLAVFGGALAALVLLFFLTDLPARRDPGAGPADIAVLVVDHGYHAGLVLPRALLADRAAALGLPLLRQVAERFIAYSWLEIGWGDEGFYRHVPTASDLTLPLVAQALFGRDNPSVLHVAGVFDPRVFFGASDLVRLQVSREGFDRVARAIEATLAKRGDRRPEELGPGLYGPSLFFRAVGAYHLTQNCNHWIARLLNDAGFPVSLAAATASAGLMADLRWRSGAKAQ